MPKYSISAFFPCYNDAKTIGGLVTKTDAILKKLTPNYEIVVVNDGSQDNSREVLEATRKKVKRLRIVSHPKNRGYGGALKSGFRTATKELVFYTDGDGQYDPAELPLLLSCLTPDIDVVNGIKIQRQDTNIRILLGNAYKSLVRNLFNSPIYDLDCDFRLMRRKFLKKVNLQVSSGAVCLELIKKLQLAGARFREVSVHHYARPYGSSQFFKPIPVTLAVLDIVKLYFTLIRKL